MRRMQKIFGAFTICMVILLSGCSNGTVGEALKESADTTTTVATSEQLVVEKQLQLIAENEKQWKLDYREKDSLVYCGPEYYDYAVTDLNQNGRLELISITYSGNGHVPISECHEVSEDGKELKEVPFDENSSNADLCLDEMEVYWDEETNTYHYDYLDYRHGSAVSHTIAFLDLVMGEEEIEASVYGYLDQKYIGKTIFYAGNKRKKISERAFAAMEAEHYAGWESKKATFGWFDTVIRDEDEMVVEEGISSEELYRRLQTSYETFGFHDNPLNIQKQLQLIAKKADQWIYAMPDASEEILDIVYYTVTDLDENGRLEVIISLVNTTHENSASWYYEVNESGDDLVYIGKNLDENETEVDLFGASRINSYLEEGNNETIIHYAVYDITKNTGKGKTEIIQDVYLKNGKIVVKEIACHSVDWEGKEGPYYYQEKKVSKKEYKKAEKEYFSEMYSNYSDWKLTWFDFSDMVSATTKVNITQEPVYEKLLDVYYENEFVAKD